MRSVLRYQKEKSEALNRRKTENIMTKRKRGNNIQTFLMRENIILLPAIGHHVKPNSND
jgi:hypothetical protein